MNENIHSTFVRLTTAISHTIHCLVDTEILLTLITPGKAKLSVLKALHETVAQTNELSSYTTAGTQISSKNALKCLSVGSINLIFPRKPNRHSVMAPPDSQCLCMRHSSDTTTSICSRFELDRERLRLDFLKQFNHTVIFSATTLFTLFRSLGRLITTLPRGCDLLPKYIDIISEQLKAGYIEPVTQEMLNLECASNLSRNVIAELRIEVIKITLSLPRLVNIMDHTLSALCLFLKNIQWESALMKEFSSADLEITKIKVARYLVIKEHPTEAQNLKFKIPSYLQTYEDQDGLVRVRRQIESPVLPQEADSQFLIYNEHRLADLLVAETHSFNGHLPENYTQAVIRTKYWIPHDAVVVNWVIGKCVPCKRGNGLPFAYPYSSILPHCRTTPSKPLSKVGLDYMVPLLYIRDDDTTYGTVHVLIYTCLTTRATMLRVVPNNTTLKYILTMKMIFREVGVSTDIYSDNALTFLLGAKVMSRDITAMEYSQTITAFLANQDITYHRITPLAPWQGGIYERVVGLVKHQLDKETRARVLDYHSLLYFVSGAQAMMNNRPLIPHSHKPGDLIALRPIDFLLPGVMLEIPTSPSPTGLPPGSTEANLRQHLEKLEESLEHMWKIWSVGYLNFLREALHKNRRCSLLLPKVGQLMIIYKNLFKRHKWPLGLIVEVHESPRDGAIRSDTVLCCGKRLTRPVCHLIPLEVETLYCQTDSMSSDIDSSNHQPPTPASSNPLESTRLPLPTPATLDTSTKVAPEMSSQNIMPNIAEARPDRRPRSTGSNPTASVDDHEEFEDCLDHLSPMTVRLLPRDFRPFRWDAPEMLTSRQDTADTRSLSPPTPGNVAKHAPKYMISATHRFYDTLYTAPTLSEYHRSFILHSLSFKTI
ncbi:hypothetical protein B9Z55_018380 [Caenorhabditis nigoni]|uniref:Integrase catalytic domain-containing protein n=1 Tax=Caenorhabditis nigoni TaxID=1611254 RepID=A0A2G5TDL8_9PELO|nr:hypothetical protein B9Z55_018380 [Caenorhabditis nigoni]